MSATVPLSMQQILSRASSGLGKVDLWGRRGVTMLSMDEAEAMALLLASLGLVPTKPGQDAPETLFITPSKEA
jgi:hypothetical protein